MTRRRVAQSGATTTEILRTRENKGAAPDQDTKIPSGCEQCSSACHEQLTKRIEVAAQAKAMGRAFKVEVQQLNAAAAKQLMRMFNTAYVLAFLLMTAVLKISSTNLGLEIDFLQAMGVVIMVAACLNLPHYIAVMSVEVEYGLGFGGLYGSRA
ncbi:hypothetical protein LTR56_022511 [Elasticomyces elasticus]|nr:hypothetical protein LTR56_022511 [Elasticomyces elasticus]KAK3632034.1 hypothetical protein LTR22_020774 [Elasticomyces elasticus]KAK4910039.1 hypothetical protein LTR49_021237 [Elasticomyces elasticus]KAK5749419.1 hypothetical protein LTS12_020529 [Elasticomyces elasticus]